MKITDVVSITELSNMLNKSRPTVYKYISDFESGNTAALPHAVKKLFTQIAAGSIPKREIYEYCEYWFAGNTPVPTKADKPTTVKEIVNLVKDNERKLDLGKIKNFILEELKR
jgi:hypothetical protein